MIFFFGFFEYLGVIVVRLDIILTAPAYGVKIFFNKLFFYKEFILKVRIKISH